MKKIAFTLLLYWLPLAVAITGLSSLVYIATQQDMRIGANDPQIQMAEDTALLLQNGGDPQKIASAFPKVSIETSLAPYVIIYDEHHKPIAGSGFLHGNLPTIPEGVFAFASLWGDNRRTWQPEEGVRSATVVVPYHGIQNGYVLAGRSLREVEKREAILTLKVFLAWAAMIGVTFFLVLFFAIIKYVLKNRQSE